MISVNNGTIDSGLLNIALPNTEGQILLWSQMICLWMLSNYVLSSDPPNESIGKQSSTKGSTPLISYRTLTYCAIAFLLPGLNFKQFGSRILIVLIVALFLVLLPLVREKLASTDRRVLNLRTAEWEVLANVLLITSIGYIIAKGALEVSLEASLLVFPIATAHLAICFLIMSAAFFLCDGGTRITRGILFKTGAAPQRVNTNETALTSNSELPSSSFVDNKEFNREIYR